MNSGSRINKSPRYQLARAQQAALEAQKEVDAAQRAEIAELKHKLAEAESLNQKVLERMQRIEARFVSAER